MSNKYQWLWRSNSSCSVFNNSEEWRKYSDVEISIIENAFHQNQDQIELDNYIIDLKNSVQINKLNPVKQQPIKRILCDDIRYSSQERFSLPTQDALRTQRKSFDEEDKSQQQESQMNKTRKESIPKDQTDDLNLTTQQAVFSTKEKLQRHFRSLSESNLAEQKHESHYKSCPSLTFQWSTNTNNNEDIFAPFRSKPFAILSGSVSGLASVGLQNLVKRYTNISLPDEDKLAWHIIEPHFSKGPPRIRLEAVFEIMQQYIDPNLSLLDVLMTDTPAIDRLHDIFAMLAQTSTVVTTNFDHLIEDAGRLHLGDDPNVVPFDVFCTEEHFKKAYDSINTGILTNLTGLWKIHGTVAIWKNKQRVLVRADEDGGPVATLKRLSLTRESIERRCFLHHLLETRPFIIINYSATDDFDVTRWLKTVKAPLNVLWIQQIDNSLEPVLWNGMDIVNGVPSNINSFDRGLIALACAWHEHDIADRLTVVTTADSIGFLLQITHLEILPQNDHPPQTDANDDYLLSLPTPWQSYIVSGAMFSHLSYFSEAKRYFDHATNISIVGTREYCLARIAAAEASIETGDRLGRIQAMNDALNAARTAPLSLNSWSNRKSQFISATVKRFVERDGQAIAITELQQLLNQCGKPEDHFPGREKNVALEAAILLAQLRRYLPSSPQPSDIARQWIELIPKTGLLHSKGMNLHESALNKYQLATNIEEFHDAINVMKEAIEIREELGHMRGLVASLNVLGSMQMRCADWTVPFQLTYVKCAAEEFRRSIEYSDKHASVFDQFQARIHLAICLLRYPSIANTNEELQELMNYFQSRTTDDLRTQIESEFCLAMNVFIHSTLSLEEMCDHGELLFNQLANKYTSNNDVRLIRILAAARFNSELCKDWKKGQAHIPNPELTRDITTRKTGTNSNAYWSMRISRAETQIPIDNYERLQLFLDPISP